MNDSTPPRTSRQSQFNASHRRALLRMRTSSSYFVVYHDFIRFLGLSIEEAAVLGDMINTAGMRDYESAGGWFDYTEKWMHSRTHMLKDAQHRIVKKLKTDGWIETRKEGYPGRRQIRINAEAIENTIDDGLNNPSRLENETDTGLEIQTGSRREIQTTSNEPLSKTKPPPGGVGGKGTLLPQQRTSNTTDGSSLRFARRLKQILVDKRKRSIPYPETSWKKEFDLLRASLDGDEQIIEEVLDWYEKEWDGIIVKSYCARTFRSNLNLYLRLKENVEHNTKGGSGEGRTTKKGNVGCSNNHLTIPEDVQERLDEIHWRAGRPEGLERFYLESLAAAKHLVTISKRMGDETEEGGVLDNLVFAMGGTPKAMALRWCEWTAVNANAWKAWGGSLKPFRLHPDSNLFKERLNEHRGNCRTGTVARLLATLRAGWPQPSL